MRLNLCESIESMKAGFPEAGILHKGAVDFIRQPFRPRNLEGKEQFKHATYYIRHNIAGDVWAHHPIVGTFS